MKKFIPVALLIITLLINFSCDKKHDPEMPDLTPPELTYFQINGEDVTEDTVHLSIAEPFTIRFNFSDNVTVQEGEFSLIINNVEDLSKIIHKGPGQSNFLYTYGLPNLMTFNHLKGASTYTAQPNDQIKFNLHAVDPSGNLSEKSITVIVF